MARLKYKKVKLSINLNSTVSEFGGIPNSIIWQTGNKLGRLESPRANWLMLNVRDSQKLMNLSVSVQTDS